MLPFILASLGFSMILLAIKMPLFEWQISEIVTDLPPEVHINPSPWVTRLGQSLDDDSYIFYQVYVSKDGLSCRLKGVNSVTNRSQNDEQLERVSLSISQKITLLKSGWNLVGLILFLCGGIYIWWFALWSGRPISEAIIFTVIVIVIFVFLAVGIWRPFLLYTVGPHLDCLGVSDRYHGTFAFTAILSKVHYETPVVLLTGILLELGALGVMVRQIMKVIFERRSGSKLTENSPE